MNGHPDSIAFVALMAVIGFIAYLRRKYPGHRHKWKEREREVLVRQKDKTTLGYRSYCVCEECGEPRHFNLYD